MAPGIKAKVKDCDLRFVNLPEKLVEITECINHWTSSIYPIKAIKNFSIKANVSKSEERNFIFIVQLGPSPNPKPKR